MPDPREIAEAEKFVAEAEAARELAALRRTQAGKAAVEAAHMEVLREQDAIKLAEMRRKEQAELALDRHHFRYAFTDAVSAASVAKCLVQLTEWSRLNPECPIEIVFTSPGGSIVDGMALFDFIQQLRRHGHHVTTSTLGMAASMAGILLQAGDKRIMGKEAWLLVHEASFGAGGKIGEVEDCVPPDMPILMADLSWCPAGELTEGQEILAFDEDAPEGRYRKWQVGIVTNANRGIRECVDVELDTGRVVRVSANHPWLTRNSQSKLRWRKASELNPGHDFVTRVCDPVGPLGSYSAGYMAGLLDADGTVSLPVRGGARVNFGQNDGPVFDWVQKEWEAQGFDLDLRSHQWPFRQANVTGGFRETMRCLSLYRPPRLIARFQSKIDGRAMVKGLDYEKVVSVTAVGPQEVVLLGTSTRTFVGDGYAMHNTVEWVKKVGERVLDIFVERAKVTRSFIKKNWTRRDWWISSDEALKYGFIDEIA